MLYDEFAKLAGIEGTRELTMDDYRKVEKVYTYHPFYAEKNKGEIAKAYTVGGLGLIEALMPAADKAEDNDKELLSWNDARDKANKELDEYDAETKRIITQREAERRELMEAKGVATKGWIDATLKVKTFNEVEKEKFEKWGKKLGLVKKEVQQ